MLVNHLKFGGKIYQGKYDVNWFIMRVKKTNIPGFVKHQELLQVDYHGKCLHIPEKKKTQNNQMAFPVMGQRPVSCVLT